MDKFVKRVQARLQYKGVSATKEQCRQAYQVVVSDTANPTNDELDLVVENLVAQLRQPAQQSASLVAATTIDVAADENLNLVPVHGNLVPTQEDFPVDSWPDKSPAQESVGQLTVPDQAPLVPGVTQQQIQSAVAQQFADRPNDIKNQVVQYASQLVFTSAKELEQMLQQLRETELSVMMQIISTHNGDRTQTLRAFQEALDRAEQERKEQSTDFFAQFTRQMAEMKAAFGVAQ